MRGCSEYSLPARQGSQAGKATDKASRIPPCITLPYIFPVDRATHFLTPQAGRHSERAQGVFVKYGPPTFRRFFLSSRGRGLFIVLSLLIAPAPRRLLEF